MAVTCSGVIRDPSNNPIPNLKITLRSIGTSATSLDGTEIVVTTGADGLYSFTLEVGRYGVFIDFGREMFVGEAVITADSTDDTLNNYLLNVELVSVIGERLAEFEAIRDATIAARTGAEQAETNAVAQVGLAAAQVTLAEEQVQLATNQANRAQTEADRASQITGLDTVDEAVDTALDNLNGITTATAVSKAMERAMNREKFAGSGWGHFGRHTDTTSDFVAINQGLSTATTAQNILRLGKSPTGGSPSGNSKVFESIANIAGFSVLFAGMNADTSGNSTIKFPEAPTGAQTYDSATGTFFDFETQSDPKYGNIAPNRNEAVLRAFGLVRPTEPVPNGAVTWDSATETFTFTGNGAAGVMSQLNPTSRNRISVTVTSSAQELIELRDGTQSNSPLLTSQTVLAGVPTTITVETTARTSTSVYMRVAAGNTGETVQVQNWTISNAVVTRRVDMWGFEGFLEEVTTTNPLVYPNGLIQSQATTMDGIATIVGTRLASYYAVFDGDTSSVGRGVNFFTATPAQRALMMGNPKNNLYTLEDGRVVQFRVRQRTVAGAGNGDWVNIFTNNLTSDGVFLAYRAQQRSIYVQGARDTAQENGLNSYLRPAHSSGLQQEAGAGIFQPFNNSATSGCGVNGECYFLVGGTVSRLNQGAYHPEFNSFGSTTCNSTAPNVTGANWNTTDLPLTSTAICFNFVDSPTNNTDAGAVPTQGAVGSLSSGRTNDSRRYDAIYANGLGGVVDYRWSANDRSDPKWGAQVKLECESGDYRGLELLQRTVVTGNTQTNSLASNIVYVDDDTLFSVGDTVSVLRASAIVLADVDVISVGAGFIRTSAPITIVQGETLNVVHTFNLDVSVSGNFNLTAIAANPDALLTTFPTGFDGIWTGVYADNEFVEFIRKSINVSGNFRTFTLNTGSTWSATGASNIDTETNISLNTVTANQVNVWSYTVDAKKTRRSTNAEVLNAQSGQYGVNATSYFDPEWGALLFESFLGKVAVSNNNTISHNQNLPFTALNLVPSTGVIDNDNGRTSAHSPLTLPAPTNSGRGVKYSTHQVNDNGQATLNFIVNELDHNGTNWGDNSQLQVEENGTYTNDNSVAGLIADIHTLSIPHGIIKNEV